MSFRLVVCWLLAWTAWAPAAEPALPARKADAPTGAEFALQVNGLALKDREDAVLAEVRAGNVPAFWRKFAEVRGERAVLSVAPDYLCVGTDDDYWYTPLTPFAAQRLADELGCTLPTRKMVDAIYRAAPLKLTPSPIVPSKAMTTVPIFSQHNTTVGTQRAAVLVQHPLGTLVAGHKKDVVITSRLAASPGRVAIYGWHRPDGTPIQSLYLGHAATWADYSHGVRLVLREMTVDGAPTTVATVLADPERSALLSDEGPVTIPRYVEKPSTSSAPPAEVTQEVTFDGGVRAVINAPAKLEPAKPVRLVVYAAPAGNTIEHTIGHRLQPGEDWHFDIQHLGAQTRWLRTRLSDANLVVVYLQAEQKSFVLWKRVFSDHPRRCVEIVESLRARYPGARLVLTGHSAGGSFTFSYLDGMESIPDEVERIAFLDSNYAYDAEKGHGAKLAAWLKASDAHRLCVLAYEDHVALLNGKTFVSASGGTWGRSQAMLAELGKQFSFTRSEAEGLQRHTALEGRVEFLLKENPEKAVLHTRQVELNGFIQGMLSGTEFEGKNYTYLGERTYSHLIADK